MNSKSTRTFLKSLFILIAQIIFMSACNTDTNNPLSPELTEPDPFLQNNKLGRGINLGNALEAPNEGDWGYIIQEEDFKTISSAGFNSIRVPIRWSAHALNNSPFTIDESFFERIDWVINKAFENGLAVVINFHHYQEMMDNPLEEKARFVVLWKQVANRYKNFSNDLFFEILNEPNNNLTSDIWNELISEIIGEIRITNPFRTIIISDADWSGIYGLQNLILPKDENNLIVTFHYYSPFQFTHQGAEWVEGSDNWLGTTWSNTQVQQLAIKNEFSIAVNWAAINNVPLNLGEFGAYHKADINSRILWTKFVADQAIENNMSFHYWEFSAGFGVYNKSSKTWNEQLLRTLIPNL